MYVVTHPENVELVTGTAQEFADKWCVPKAAAYAFITSLKTFGFAKVISKRKSLTGMGKPTDVYSIPSTLTFTF